MKIKIFLAYVQVFLIVSLSFVFSINLNATEVFADEEQQVCCQQDNSGNYCGYVPLSQCTGENILKASTSCDQTSFCRTGTCAGIDGFCYDGYPKALCEARGGSFNSGARSQDVVQCQLGCCITGTQADFVTRDRCINATSAYPDLEVDFREEVKSEQECLNLARNQDQGCCVRPEGSCTYGSRAECSLQDVLSGDGFYKDTFCSDSSLRNNCECASHPSITEDKERALRATTCLPDRDEVYWVDSCGNPEGIVESGLSGQKNSVSDNGHCDYNKGTLCGDSDRDGIFVCESLDCSNNKELSIELKGYDEHGTKVDEVKSGGGVLNGESWCQFDSKDQTQTKDDLTTADRKGKDPVGSRYYRSLCINGKELIEPCKDFREEYCYSNTIEVVAANRDYTESRCIKNEWEPCVNECTTANPLTMNREEYEDALEKDQQCCLKSNRDCAWINNKCVPGVSPGFKFWENEGADVCGKASTECTVTFACGGWNRIFGCEDAGQNALFTGGLAGGGSALYTGLALGSGAGVPIVISGALGAFLVGGSSLKSGWHIVGGKECLSQDYLQAANNLCRSYGDCGADFNYLHDDVNDPKFTLSVAGFTNTENIQEDLASAARNDLDYDFGEEVPGNLTGEPSWDAGEEFFDFRKPSGPEGGFLGKSKRILFTEDDLAGGVLSPGALAGYSLAAGIILGGLAPGQGTLLAGGVIGLKASPLGFLVAQGLSHIGVKSLEKTFEQGLASGTKATADKFAKTAYDEAFEKSIGQADRTIRGPLWKAADKAGKKAAEKARQQFFNRELSGVLTGVSSALWAYTIFQLGDVLFEKVTPVAIKSTCQPWQAPVYRVRSTEEDPCQKCNPDFKDYIDKDGKPVNVKALKACSEYRCKSLGASCELLNEGTGEELCTSINKLDTNSPKINPWIEGLSLEKTRFSIQENSGKTGFKIVDTDNKGIPIYTPFMLGLQTDEPSQCKMSLDHSARYNDMANNFFGGNAFSYFHVNQMVYPATRGSNQTEGITLQGGGHYKLNVRCTDAVGNANEVDYTIEFDVSEEPDITPPNIVGSSLSAPNVLAGEQSVISNQVYLTHGANYTDVTLFLNEPAECKYSYNPLEYNLMDESNKCNVVGNDPSAPPYYECKFVRGISGAGYGPAPSNLNSRAGSVQYVYFKCKDHKGNFNRDAYTVLLKGSDELRIRSTGPTGLLKTSTAVVNVTLQAQTEGGALLNGNSVCKYTTDQNARNNIVAMTEFLNTNSSLHKQPWQPSTGQQNFYVGCYDLAGNLAYGTIQFEVEQDVTPPFITKVYRDENFQPPQFTVELNEPGECKDSTENTFEYLTGGNLMNIVNENSTIFASTVPTSDVYYVTCKDDFGNIMNPATVQIAEV